MKPIQNWKTQRLYLIPRWKYRCVTLDLEISLGHSIHLLPILLEWEEQDQDWKFAQDVLWEETQGDQSSSSYFEI
jgi:hypothetical protein